MMFFFFACLKDTWQERRERGKEGGRERGREGGKRELNFNIKSTGNYPTLPRVPIKTMDK